ncbi:MAG: cycA 2 [Verrucomicrobiales bacterium]|nr:cycA 2 [Verrucomicrobiales bacterium]
MNSDAKHSKQTVRGDDAPPQVNDAPAPVIFFFLLAAGIFAAGLFIDQHGGGFNHKVYAPYHSYDQVVAIQPVDEGGKLARKGQQIYSVACLPCHQANGTGVVGQNPPLAGSEWVLAASPERMIRIVLSGLVGPVKVKDAEYGAAAMPPWRDTYTDEDIAAVITFVRGNKDWGNKASAVKPADVKKIRDETESHKSSWTADELQSVPEK